jgi:RNA polymerase sigma factor (TIGR02999 family)
MSQTARTPAEEALSREIASLLLSARGGDTDAVDRIVPLLYERRRSLARRQLRRLRPGRTLDTTTLVHETYIKLAAGPEVDWRDRNHFLCAAAVAMRHILVDEARRRTAQRRGGGAKKVGLSELGDPPDPQAVEILDLDRALQSLEELDPRLARLVELRFFGGLTVEETGSAMELSERTVKREWRKARALLYRRLAADAPEGSEQQGSGRSS